MDQDDRPVGRILSRREVLALLGTTGAALLAACVGVEIPQVPPTQAPASVADLPATDIPASATPPATAAVPTLTATSTAVEAPACVVRPELTEGPYFVDEQLNRADIRSEPSDNTMKEGLPLQLTIQVLQLNDNACVALPDAQVDIWHCDAQGVYSGVTDNAVGFTTVGQKFLRGYQISGSDGKVGFTTIYPGWYRGRAVHIHFKIRTTTAQNAAYEFTSQFFFDDTTSDEVFSQAPYASKGQRDTRNDQDGIYRGGGEQLLLPLTPTEDGYAATFSLALDFSDTQTGQSDSAQGFDGRSGGNP